jgi:DNA-binding transcriptional LysR family regulator
MSAAEPSWELYETFLEVMRGGSLSAASRTLSVAQPTVRRRIEQLEEALGAVLFTRAPNGLVPTDAARTILPLAESMATNAQALVRRVSAPADADRGTVRLTTSEIVGAEVMPSILASLRRTHPGIQIELALSNRNQDLLRRDAELAVRMIAPTQSALVARRIGRIELGLYASDGYLEACAPPRRLTELKNHALIGSDRDRGIHDALEAAGLSISPRDFALRTDSDLAQLAAVRAGVGIGVCQVPLARRSPHLRRVLPKLAFHLDAWVVTHEDLRTVRRVRTVFDHLVRELGRYIDGEPASATP